MFLRFYKTSGQIEACLVGHISSTLHAIWFYLRVSPVQVVCHKRLGINKVLISVLLALLLAPGIYFPSLTDLFSLPSPTKTMCTGVFNHCLWTQLPSFVNFIMVKWSFELGLPYFKMNGFDATTWDYGIESLVFDVFVGDSTGFPAMALACLLGSTFSSSFFPCYFGASFPAAMETGTWL